VQYSRILPLQSSFSHLFIRECRVIVSAFLFLALCSSLFAKADAEYKTTINFQTCCPFQSQYNVHDGICESANSTEYVKFPETLNLPVHLISKAYRNMAGNHSFRYAIHDKLKLSCWLPCNLKAFMNSKNNITNIKFCIIGSQFLFVFNLHIFLFSCIYAL